MEGFIVLDWAAQFPAAMKQMAIWVSQGQVKSKNTVVKGGLEQAEQALADLFKGLNTGERFIFINVSPSWKSTQTDMREGKLVVEVKEPTRS